MKTVLAGLAMMIGMGVVAAENPCLVAVARDDWSASRSAHFTRLAAAGKVGGILMLGDSITHLWSFPADHKYPGGKEVWEDVWEPLGATNFGISGDKVEHVLYRITTGKQLDGIQPRVITLMIGTNNLHAKPQPQTPDEIAAGIANLVRVIREKQPQARILLLGVFPRGFAATDPYREKIRTINAKLAPLHDGEHVFYLDLGPVFLEADGSATREVLRDGLHLSAAGYRLWADAMLPHVQALLDNSPDRVHWGTPPQ